jgi:CheY-like chemotaxis protein
VRQRTETDSSGVYACRVIQEVPVQAHSLAALKRVSMDNYFSAPTPPSLALEPGDLRVLIVNEDMRSAKSLKAALRDLGYLCTFTAYSARRALELADELAPAVAFLDLELPDMSGFQLAQHMRVHGCGHVREIQLLAVAESSVAGDDDRTRAAGFMGCLTKPVPALEWRRLMDSIGGRGTVPQSPFDKFSAQRAEVVRIRWN